MKTKAINIIAILALVMALATSCGKKDNELELDVTNAKVEGDSADVISIVDGKYTIVGTEKGQMGQELSIKVKFRLERNIKAAYNQIMFTEPYQGIQILDKNDLPMLQYPLAFDNVKEFYKFITEGKAGDEKEMLFHFLMINEEQYNKILEEAVAIKFTGMKFKICSYIEPAADSKLAASEKEPEEAEENVTETTETGSESSEDVDQLLADYEKYFDSYISLMKKAQKGDMSAMADYVDMLQKAQKIGEEIENVKGELTPKQLATFNRINNKLMKAAQEMH